MALREGLFRSQDQIEQDLADGPGWTIDQQKPAMWEGFGLSVATGAATGVANGIAALAHGLKFQDSLSPMEAVMNGPAAAAAYAKGGKSAELEPWQKNVNEALDTAETAARDYAKTLIPDPRTTGSAANLVHGFSKAVTEFGAGALAGGPLAGAMVLGTSEGYARYLDLREQGVDDETARKSAILTGLQNGGGAILPMALPGKLLAGLSVPGTLLTQAGVGAAINASFGAVGRAGDAAILRKAGYPDMADQMAPWDEANLATDAITGLFFGAYAGLHGLRDIRVDPSVRDAAKAVQDRQEVINRAPGVPVDMASAAIHREALQTALGDLLNDKPVSLDGDRMEGATFARPGQDLKMAQDIMREEFEKAEVLDAAGDFDDWLRGNVPRNVPRDVQLSHEELQMREAHTGQWTEILPGMPPELYARLARHAPSEFGTAEKEQLQELRTRVLASGETPEAGMRALWGPELADASPRLREALTGDLAVPILSPAATQRGEVGGAGILTPESVQARIKDAEGRLAAAGPELTPEQRDAAVKAERIRLAEPRAVRERLEATYGEEMPKIVAERAEATVRAPEEARAGAQRDLEAAQADQERLARAADPVKAALGQRPDLELPGATMELFHGSPHEFSSFDLSHIGEGEGAQAYGHGIYLAEHPEVAGNYAEGSTQRLSKSDLKKYYEVGTVRDLSNGIKDKIIAYDLETGMVTAERTEPRMKPYQVEYRDTGTDWIKLRRALGQVLTRKNLYTASLPRETMARMIDFDKPIAEQPAIVLDAFRKLGVLDESDKRLELGADLYWKLAHQLGGDHTDDRAASEALKAEGIAGSRYLDQMSRVSAGRGTHNVVLFDEKLAQITHRNEQPIRAVDALEIVRAESEQADREAEPMFNTAVACEARHA